MDMANQSHATLRRVGVRCAMRFILSRMRLLRVEDGLKKQDAYCREDDVVAGEVVDPCSDLEGVQVGGEDSGGGLDHCEQGRKRDGEEQEGEEKFAVAGAEAEGGEEGSVDDQRPCPQGQDKRQKPYV